MSNQMGLVGGPSLGGLMLALGVFPRVGLFCLGVSVTAAMEMLHGQTVPGMLKELTVLAMIYNLVRMVMWHSAILQHIAVERISFLDALRWYGAPSPETP